MTERTDSRICRTVITRENSAMLIHEALARARMREDQRIARQLRLARRLAAVRRWSRLADYAGQRAARASRGL